MRFFREGRDYSLRELEIAVSPFREDQSLLDKLRLVRMLSREGIPKDDGRSIEEFIERELKKTRFRPYKKALLRLGVQLAHETGSTGLFEVFQSHSRGVFPSAIRDLARLGLFFTYGEPHSVTKVMLDSGARRGLQECRGQALFHCIAYLSEDPQNREEALVAAVTNYKKFKNLDPVIELLASHYDETVSIGSSFLFANQVVALLSQSNSKEALRLMAWIYNETSYDRVKFTFSLALASALKSRGRSEFEVVTDLYASDIYHDLLLIIIGEKAEKKTAKLAQEVLLDFGTEGLEYVLRVINKSNLGAKPTKFLDALIKRHPEPALRWIRRNSYSLEEADVSFLGPFWRYLTGMMPTKTPTSEQENSNMLELILRGIKNLESERR